MSVCHRRHSGEDGVEEDESKKSKRHRNDKDRSSDKRDDDDRCCTHAITAFICLDTWSCYLYLPVA